MRTAARVATYTLLAAAIYIGPFILHHYWWTALHH